MNQRRSANQDVNSSLSASKMVSRFGAGSSAIDSNSKHSREAQTASKAEKQMLSNLHSERTTQKMRSLKKEPNQGEVKRSGLQPLNHQMSSLRVSKEPSSDSIRVPETGH